MQQPRPRPIPWVLPVHILPHLYLPPRLLIHVVVDGNDHVDVSLAGVIQLRCDGDRQQSDAAGTNCKVLLLTFGSSTCLNLRAVLCSKKVEAAPSHDDIDNNGACNAHAVLAVPS